MRGVFECSMELGGDELDISIEFDYSPFRQGSSEYKGGPPIEPDEQEEVTINGVELVIGGPDPRKPYIDSKSITLPMELFSKKWIADMEIKILESKDE